jgi:hypothetical protein
VLSTPTKIQSLICQNTVSTLFPSQSHPIKLQNTMKENHPLIAFVLLVSIMGCLALTASDYVGCESCYADEFLDLGLACQIPILNAPVPHWNTHPPCFLSMKSLCAVQKAILLNTLLRC